MNEHHGFRKHFSRNALAFALAVCCGPTGPATLLAHARPDLDRPTQRFASDTLPVPPGARIRIYTDVERVGIVRAQRADTLVWVTCDACAPEQTARQSIVRLDVSSGRRSSPSRTLVGALAGAAVGAIAGYALIGHSNRHCHGDTCSLDYLGVPLYAAGGIVVGAITGSRIRSERWDPVSLSSQR